LPLAFCLAITTIFNAHLLSLNDSVSPQVNTSIFTPLSIGRKYSKEEILKADSKQLEAIIKASTNHPTAHIKSGFDEDK
jgi:hypothetical protein